MPRELNWGRAFEVALSSVDCLLLGVLALWNEHQPTHLVLRRGLASDSPLVAQVDHREHADEKDLGVDDAGKEGEQTSEI